MKFMWPAYHTEITVHGRSACYSSVRSSLSPYLLVIIIMGMSKYKFFFSGNKIRKNSCSFYCNVENYGSGRSQNNPIASWRERIALGKTIAEGNAKIMAWLGKRRPKILSLLGKRKHHWNKLKISLFTRIWINPNQNIPEDDTIMSKHVRVW